MSNNRPIATARISVTLLYDDWKDLINFITGDLHNMEEGTEVKTQMRNICETIRLKLASSRAMKGGH